MTKYFKIMYKGQVTEIEMDIFSDLSQEIYNYASTLGHKPSDEDTLEYMNESMYLAFNELFNLEYLECQDIINIITDQDEYIDAVRKIVNIDCVSCLYTHPSLNQFKFNEEDPAYKKIQNKMCQTFLNIFNERLASF